MKKLLLCLLAIVSLICFARKKPKPSHIEKLENGWTAIHFGNFEVKADEDGWTAIVKFPGQPLLITKDVKSFPQKRIVFDGDITAKRGGVVSLDIKIAKEKGVPVSSWNFAGTTRLRAETDGRKAKKASLICNVAAEEVGDVISGKNFFFGVLPCPEKSSITITPGFISAAYEIKGIKASTSCNVKTAAYIRKTGTEKWISAYPPDFLAIEYAARGVMINLSENTKYDVKVEIDNGGKKELFTSRFTTRSSLYPIAETIILTPQMVKNGFTVTKSGTPQGYIRYTAKADSILTSVAENAITVKDAQYVMFDGLTIIGGKNNGINITNSRNIIIRNCDISLFGEIGKQLTQRGGSYYVDKKLLNSDAGIYLFNVDKALIERNFIHDPNGYTCSWFYRHPTGPKAVYANMASDVTLRFNDFIGGDLHRWNDAVESGNNKGHIGGLYRNAEIYGNLFALSNDDGIELEGGEINTRFFRNRVESTLSGVSSGSCARGPSYIFENLFWRGGDQHGTSSNIFKNGSGSFGHGKVFIFNNTALDYQAGICGPGSDIATRPDKYVFVNNIVFTHGNYCSAIGLFSHTQNIADYNLFKGLAGYDLKYLQQFFKQEAHSLSCDADFINSESGDFRLKPESKAMAAGTAIPGFTAEKCNIGAFQKNNFIALPWRNIPAQVAPLQLLYTLPKNDKPQNVVLTAEKGFSGKFKIVKPFEAEWLEIQPSHGKLADGKSLILRVKILNDKIKHARLNKTIFLVRFEDGTSLPVSITADSRDVQELRERDRKNILTSEIVSAEGKKTVIFNVPEHNYYYIMLYGKTAASEFKIRQNGKEIFVGSTPKPEADAKNKWFNVKRKGKIYLPLELQPGTHIFELDYSDKIQAIKVALITNADQLMPTAEIE